MLGLQGANTEVGTIVADAFWSIAAESKQSFYNDAKDYVIGNLFVCL